MKADIQAGTIQTTLGGNIAGEGLSYDTPACHPSQHILAASTQPNIKVPGKILSIFDLDSGAATPVMDDLTKIPGFYTWDPAGDHLLFQMSIVSKEKDDFEIWVWDKNTLENRIIAKGFWSPAWLP